jgi:hypothetical protein
MEALPLFPDCCLLPSPPPLTLNGHTGRKDCATCTAARAPDLGIYLAVREFVDDISTKIGVSIVPCRRVAMLTARKDRLPRARLVHVQRVPAGFTPECFPGQLSLNTFCDVFLFALYSATSKSGSTVAPGARF